MKSTLIEASNRTPVEFDHTDAEDVRTLRECGAVMEKSGVWLKGFRVRFQVPETQALGRDGYRIAREGGELRIVAASRVGRLAGLLAATEMLGSGRKTFTQTLKFNRRFYKH